MKFGKFLAFTFAFQIATTPLCTFASTNFGGGYIGGKTSFCLIKGKQIDTLQENDAEKTVFWNGYVVKLTNDWNGSKIQFSIKGNVWTDIDLSVFAESDIELFGDEVFEINDIEVYGDQLYAVCNDGIVIIITSCSKCYRLKKLTDFDINKIMFNGSNVELFGKNNEKSVFPVSFVRQNNISGEEALNLAGNGAIIIDVREKEEFCEAHFYNSVNIPISQIDEILKYPRDTIIIFCCLSGGRAEKALKFAQEKGFVNVYNVGGYEKLQGN